MKSAVTSKTIYWNAFLSALGVLSAGLDTKLGLPPGTTAGAGLTIGGIVGMFLRRGTSQPMTFLPK